MLRHVGAFAPYSLKEGDLLCLISMSPIMRSVMQIRLQGIGLLLSSPFRGIALDRPPVGDCRPIPPDSLFRACQAQCPDVVVFIRTRELRSFIVLLHDVKLPCAWRRAGRRNECTNSVNTSLACSGGCFLHRAWPRTQVSNIDVAV